LDWGLDGGWWNNSKQQEQTLFLLTGAGAGGLLRLHHENAAARERRRGAAEHHLSLWIVWEADQSSIEKAAAKQAAATKCISKPKRVLAAATSGPFGENGRLHW
jgi:hypothetical protein